MKKYKVISFDIFQTLVDVNQRIPEIWKELLGIEYTIEEGMQRAESVLKNIGPLYEEACHEFVTMTTFYTLCGKKVTDEGENRYDAVQFADSIMRNHGFAPYYEHVIEMLDYLRPNYKIIISSDASHLMADPIIAKVRPDAAFISDDLGCYKGTWDNAFFTKVLKNLEVDPEEVLHIGDSVGDIRGAHLTGVDSCWVNRDHRVWKEEYRPTYEIQNFLELKQWL